jgi:hypothetical protein
MYYILYDMFGVVKYAELTSPGPTVREQLQDRVDQHLAISSPRRWRARAAAARPYRSGVHEHAERQGDRGRYQDMGGAIEGKPLMPSHPQLSGDDLAAVVAFVRSLSEPPSGQ